MATKCAMCGSPRKDNGAKWGLCDKCRAGNKVTEKNPRDLLELGKKYPALKKEYDELKILCDESLAIKFIAESGRDRLLKACKRASKHLNTPKGIGLDEIDTILKRAIKNNSK